MANQCGTRFSEIVEALQEDALLIYGKYDLDKSIVWMAEEFGEVVKAIHKNEGKEAIEEELGDLLAWIFCLANITGVSVHGALQGTFQKEIQRQQKKYGKLKYCPSGMQLQSVSSNV
ncbi:hypothetical protein D3Z52_00635 [Clostridiaceae bacterium]|nr:hypothetical protein [Clostridiaceae bacterium]NBI81406.1 hypothetical protein [Clostridiaceae bacterium]RKJ82981.1 hypothetical protein D7X33_00570 [Butyricicoccus sp. 1XD8-22]